MRYKRNSLKIIKDALKSHQRFKNKAHSAFTEEINKIVLSSKDDTRLQTFDKVTSSPY